MTRRPPPNALLLVVPLLLAVAAYARVLHGEFVFDDVRVVKKNPALGDPAGVLGGFVDGLLHGGRPTTELTFALSHALGGPVPVGVPPREPAPPPGRRGPGLPLHPGGAAPGRERRRAGSRAGGGRALRAPPAPEPGGQLREPALRGAGIRALPGDAPPAAAGRPARGRVSAGRSPGPGPSPSSRSAWAPSRSWRRRRSPGCCSWPWCRRPGRGTGRPPGGGASPCSPRWGSWTCCSCGARSAPSRGMPTRASPSPAPPPGATSSPSGARWPPTSACSPGRPGRAPTGPSPGRGASATRACSSRVRFLARASSGAPWRSGGGAGAGPSGLRGGREGRGLRRGLVLPRPRPDLQLPPHRRRPRRAPGLPGLLGALPRRRAGRQAPARAHRPGPARRRRRGCRRCRLVRPGGGAPPAQRGLGGGPRLLERRGEEGAREGAAAPGTGGGEDAARGPGGSGRGVLGRHRPRAPGSPHPRRLAPPQPGGHARPAGPLEGGHRAAAEGGGARPDGDGPAREPGARALDRRRESTQAETEAREVLEPAPDAAWPPWSGPGAHGARRRRRSPSISREGRSRSPVRCGPPVRPRRGVCQQRPGDRGLRLLEGGPPASGRRRCARGGPAGPGRSSAALPDGSARTQSATTTGSSTKLACPGAWCTRWVAFR